MVTPRSHIIFFLAAVLLISCSDPNTEAPVSDKNHPSDWVLTHELAANLDLEGCKICHGADLTGSSAVAGCFACHIDGPPFSIHISTWTNAIIDHRDFQSTMSWTTCAVSVCHGVDLKGGHGSGPTGPSCFNAQCHAEGPPIPHSVPFNSASSHGTFAKENQLLCRNCHGRPQFDFDGGFVAAADILNKPNGQCSANDCHPNAKAHPTNWQGSNEDKDQSYVSTHRTVDQTVIDKNCILCHKTDGAGSGPFSGAPSCFSVSFTNSDNSTTGCHSNGPGTAPHGVPFQDPTLHGPEAKNDLGYCQECHGNSGTIYFNGNIATTACSSCHPAADAHPTRWQGSNDITADYTSTHRTAGALDTACAICHNVTADTPGPHPDAPSCFSVDFTNSDGSSTSCHASGPGALHALPFTDPSLHGPEAKKDLSYCQGCHGNPGTIQFDGNIASTACSLCHPAASAHPTRWQGSNDITADYAASHRTAGNMSTTCSICHDFTQGDTPPNPAAPSCFSTDFTNSDGSNSSCHPGGPKAPHASGSSWLDPAGHGAEAKQDITYCQGCHANPASGGPNPRFNVAFTNYASGCETCHNQNSAHPVPWLGAAGNSHKTAGNLPGSCILCHGDNLQGPGEGGVGKRCEDCHIAGLPTVLTNCSSCHNIPPDGGAPTGNVRPNRAGAHIAHNDLPQLTGSANCGACHNNAGTNTLNHFDTTEPANVSILAAYDDQSAGGPAYNDISNSCSNVSCHGGQTTPDWATDTIAITAVSNCLICHEDGTSSPTEYNSPSSGRHRKHRNASDFSCQGCHDVGKMTTTHFNDLDTQIMSSAEARATITMPSGSNITISYNSSTNRCNGDCHDNNGDESKYHENLSW